jgi:hypothetical protein
MDAQDVTRTKGEVHDGGRPPHARVTVRKVRKPKGWGASKLPPGAGVALCLDGQALLIAPLPKRPPIAGPGGPHARVTGNVSKP